MPTTTNTNTSLLYLLLVLLVLLVLWANVLTARGTCFYLLQQALLRIDNRVAHTLTDSSKSANSLCHLALCRRSLCRSNLLNA